ncbi:hypothetical protein OG607_32470 [Streptomyces sp. NBC_01537]
MTDTWDTIADWYAARIRTGSPMHAFARDLHGHHALDLGWPSASTPHPG